jgi:hypothetical protein
MAPYTRWIHDSFEQTLIDTCDEYLDTNDRGGEKKRSKLITRVSKEIAAIGVEQNVAVPNELEKVIPNHHIYHAY